MGGGREFPTTPGKANGKAPAAPQPEDTPEAGPSQLQQTQNDTYEADDTHETNDNGDWDPIKELGVFEVEWGQITCLGRTWGNKRCRRGPSATLNRPCYLHESPEIQECLQSLTDTPLIEVATTKTNLLQDLAEAMMCLNEPDGDSEWQGHSQDQAAAQATVWRRRLVRKAGLVRIPRTMRTEMYAMREPAKRRRDEEASSPSSKRHAAAAANEDEEDLYGISSSQVSAAPHGSQDSNGDPAAPTRRPSPPVRNKSAGGLSSLPKDVLVGGVRKMELDLQARDATIRDLEHELRIASEIIVQIRQEVARLRAPTNPDEE